MKSMQAEVIERALALLGERLSYPSDIEILLVGGAAGMLTGQLAPTRTTIDCDVMAALPPDALSTVERAAQELSDEMGLAPNWLNSDVQLRRDALPTTWRSRRVLVGQWGRLRVLAISRLDLLAMKVLSGRPQDLEDIRAIGPTSDDLRFVREYLEALPDRGTLASEVDEARELLLALESRHG
jgi:hypothetical protein